MPRDGELDLVSLLKHADPFTRREFLRRAALVGLALPAAGALAAACGPGAPQAQSTGVQIDVPGTVTIPAGGSVAIPVTVHANAAASLGENYGFVVLSGNGVQRRVPYGFLVERPALRDAPVVALQKLQTGDTAAGTNRPGCTRTARALEPFAGTHVPFWLMPGRLCQR